MENRLTAVQLLQEELRKPYADKYIANIFNKAIQMEREQIEEAFVAGDERGTKGIPFNAEQYYTQTFKP